MTIYDDKYITLADDILQNGYFDNNRTGIPTYKLPHQIMQFNLEKEFPILTTKFVAFKVAVKELLWIFKDQSNSVEKLKEQNVRIWNEWEQEDGTIGTAYGWVVKKFNQMDELIDALKNNPQDRRMMINLWQIPYLKTGALAPCCFCTMWDVTDGKLNCMLIQRSGDCGLGVPFNTTQYAVLVHLLAQVTGLKPGLLTHVINNAHIYDNHVEPLKQQIKNYEKLKTMKNDLEIHGDKLKEYYESKYSAEEMKDFDKYLDVLKSKPVLSINPDVKDFYDFTPDDINIEGYNSLPTIKMVVAV